MNIHTIEAAKADAALRARIDAAIQTLAAQGVPQSFSAALLHGAAPEDVSALSSDTLVRLTQEAFSHLSRRAAGRHDVRVYNPDWPGAPAITVIEAVNDDMSFLFDSVAGELADRGLDLKLTSHPILAVARTADGTLQRVEADLHAADHRDLPHESFIHIHVQQIDSEEARAALKAGLDHTLDDVRVANADFLAMRGEVEGVARAMRGASVPYATADRAEASDFVEWLTLNNFIFIGVRKYALGADGALVAESGLGILRDASVTELGDAGSQGGLIDPARPLLITKSSLWCRVHRRAYLDFVGLRLHGADGRQTGELRIVGLFTSNVYTHSVRQIPYLRQKSAVVVQRAGFEEDSHSGKALATVLETYPRDDLFQIDADTLLPYALDILSLYDRPRVRVLPRPDPFGRFVSVLVFVPRDRYDGPLRGRIGARLAETFGGEVAGFIPTFLADVPLTRVHFMITRDGSPVPQVDRAALEAAVAQDALSWSDKLRDALRESAGAQTGALMERYGAAFGAGYSAAFGVETAVADIERLERLSAERPVALDFYRRDDDPATRISLRLISYGRPLPLSERVPMLENMGLKPINERTYRLRPMGPEGEVTPSWVHDMSLERSNGGTLEVSGSAERLEDLLTVVLRGEAESDGFNALLLDTALTWRDVALVRALARYLRQAGIPYSQDYLWTTLVHHADIAARIVDLFHARFDPSLEGAEEARTAREAPLREAIEAALAEVSSLDEDTILRRFLNLVDAALRTTFYQLDADGRPKGPIAIKYASAKVEGLPLPRPQFEVFVYSPRVEGVHLRFGHVARGGLRWSDRPQDFRTEVLGLVKAQQVKNAVIVPVGAKGGFVPKRLPVGGTRDAIQAEGIAAYKVFVSSLLDVTDNLKGGEVVHPDHVVRLDADDPYLVVAADKGTATFSDIANGISQDHGFWLDDAFASGGSVGYDHKAMGITARGAWEAVKRHFREIDIDIQTTPIRVVGVGDMSGDVFGNGMLLSTALKLVAAFDHRHIFLDPNPDPAASHAERQRMFNLPRSSWEDYDARLISQGGGVFPRSAKSIPLSPEVRAMLGLQKAEATPSEVMTAILKAEADLLWFGGIGTYVRASVETDAQVGDRANDAIRIAAADLRVKAVGEGANLGMTQRGRIEAARRGVRLNTDAIDNSAGVNTSDVEVNIKIALAAPVAEGVLTAPDRAALLGEMTQEVGHLVLRNNYLQTLALSLAQRAGTADTSFQQRLMQMLELRGELDRTVENLPSDGEIQERRTRGEALTRPELAVLLAYAKLSLYAELLTTDVPDDRYVADELVHYFPHALQSRFPAAIEGHRLRREIIATALANALINQGGPATVARIADQTGADAAGIVRAFVAVRDSFGLADINAAIDALDNKISGEVQLRLYADVQYLVLARIIWFLRNANFAAGLGAVVAQYRDGILALGAVLDQALPEHWVALRNRRAQELMDANVPEDLARTVAGLRPLAAGTDIVLLSQNTGRAVAEAAATFFAAGRYFAVDEVIAAAAGILAPDYYDQLALDRAMGQIETFVRDVSVAMLATGKSGPEAVEAWVDSRRKEVERSRATVQDIVASGLTLSKLTLAASLLADLARA
ncbi:MAG: NAD-glutamate dehydrogenase [Pseudomonadota bacterium]